MPPTDTPHCNSFETRAPLDTWTHRKPKNLRKLSQSPRPGRLVIVNHFNRVVDALTPTSHRPRLKAFLPSNLWSWIWSYLKYVFEPKFPFQSYANSSKRGVYRIRPAMGKNRLRIAIAGSWGTGTDEARTVATLINEKDADFTIHLGDVHYVGDTEEINANYFGQSAKGYDGVKWPLGAQGTFALNGNHEMYANGHPYFTVLLKRIGLNSDHEGQVASFFCLQSDHWRIIAIDTGYNSVGLPILGLIPGLREIPVVGGDCRLEPALLDWLRDEVGAKSNPMPTVLLSHHQYFTAFPEENHPRPANQLAEFFEGQEIVWLWGHEHRLGIYEKYRTSEGLTFYGRCIGHGGMPVELAEPDITRAPLALFDGNRSHVLDDGTPVGENGFVVLSIAGPELTLEYRDTDDTSVLTERFHPRADGALDYRRIDPGILITP
jgi:hypothetical protein